MSMRHNETEGLISMMTAAMPEILEMIPDREQWLAELTTMRVAGVLLARGERDLERVLAEPELLSMPEILIETAEHLEAMAAILRLAEARLVEHCAR